MGEADSCGGSGESGGGGSRRSPLGVTGMEMLKTNPNRKAQICSLLWSMSVLDVPQEGVAAFNTLMDMAAYELLPPTTPSRLGGGNSSSGSSSGGGTLFPVMLQRQMRMVVLFAESRGGPLLTDSYYSLKRRLQELSSRSSSTTGSSNGKGTAHRGGGRDDEGEYGSISGGGSGLSPKQASLIAGIVQVLEGLGARCERGVREPLLGGYITDIALLPHTSSVSTKGWLAPPPPPPPLPLAIIVEGENPVRVGDEGEERAPRGTQVLRQRLMMSQVGKAWGGVVVMRVKEWNEWLEGDEGEAYGSLLRLIYDAVVEGGGGEREESMAYYHSLGLPPPPLPPPRRGMPSSEKLWDLRVVDLKEVLRTKGLPVSGRKHELIERLMESGSYNQS